MNWTRDSLAGVEVALARHDGHGVPVVLLGAWPQTLEGWAGVWERLGDRTRLALDLPGFGHSETRPVTPSSAGAYLIAALDELGWDRVLLVAPDVGVPVGLWVAHHHPERLTGLVLSDGPGTWPPPLSRDLTAMMKSSVLRWFLALDPGRFVRIAAKRGYTARAPTHVASSEAAYRDKIGPTLGFIASYPKELPSIAASEHIRTPTLVLWGGADVFVPPENARRIHAALPDSELVILDGVGHFSHDDDPETYAEALLGWMERRLRFPASA